MLLLLSKLRVLTGYILLEIFSKYVRFIFGSKFVSNIHRKAITVSKCTIYSHIYS